MAETGAFRLVPLTRGMFAKVSPRRYDDISRWKWYANFKGKSGKTAYAARRTSLDEGHRTIAMHRYLLGLERGDSREGDHINHDGLDNRDENLRIADRKHNALNQMTRIDNTSGHKGVAIFKRDKKWRAYIYVDGRQRHIGLFDQKQDAIAAYRRRAIELRGEFACF